MTIQGANASSTTDYEQLTYDAAGNVTSRIPRGGSAANPFNYVYDKLNRLTAKGPPNPEPTTAYAYDNLGRLTSATLAGHALTFTYDALGRNLTQTGPQGTVSSQWDLAGRRTKLTYPGSGLYVDYDYLVTGEMAKIRENGAASGIGVLATFGYDDLGRRISLTYGNGTSTSYSYDPVSRLTALTNDLADTSNDLTIGSMSYNPASQIMSQTRSNDAFAWTGHGTGSTAGVANGLNQLTSIGGSATTHDARGNLTSDPTTGKTYGYSSENLLTSASGGATLGYDPSMRLYQVVGAATVRFAYDGTDMIAEYNGSNVLQRRFVHGPGMDEPLVQYEGTGNTDRRFLHADERGSIVAISDGTGNLLTTNRYDEFGKPQSTNAGRFQYTGQMWLGEIGAYHYKARVYFAHLGRFGQTDPIGYGSGLNMYAYVENDPINLGDPSGMMWWPSRIELQRDNMGNTSWEFVSGTTSFGGLLDSSGNVRVDVANNIFWESTDGGPGQWGGQIIFSGGVFRDASSLSTTVSAMHFESGSRATDRIAQRSYQISSTLDQIVAESYRTRVLAGTPIDFDIPAPAEQKWLSYPGDRIVYMGISGASWAGDLGVSRITGFQLGYTAIIHSHPHWASDTPGLLDYGKRVPVYGITPFGVWKINVWSRKHIWLSGGY